MRHMTSESATVRRAPTAQEWGYTPELVYRECCKSELRLSRTSR
jgi:hypothetical protein